MNINFNTENLKRQIEEQPLVAAGIGIGLLTGVSKLMNANTNRRNAKTWRNEVDRRRRK